MRVRAHERTDEPADARALRVRPRIAVLCEVCLGVRCARIAVPRAWGRSTALLCTGSALCWHSSAVSGMRGTGAIGITDAVR